MADAAPSGDEPNTTAARPRYADGAKSRVSVLRMPRHDALSKMSPVLGGNPDPPPGVPPAPPRALPYESLWLWWGLEGADAGAEDGEETPGRTMMVSTMPIMRVASVRTGPEPPLRE